MRDIHVLTREAHANGVSQARIASLLAFMASAALDPKSETKAGERPGEPVETLRGEIPRCPDCSEVIQALGGALGTVTAKPCGHIIEDDELIDELIEGSNDDY